jgi:aryl-alcohol dehydrogenase-like predicted oxidoreductase
MRYRMLGKAGFEVSEVGFGAWGIGGDWWKGGSDEEALAALRRAADLGITYVDTAMGYGAGHSERLIGQALRGHTEKVHVGTKIQPMNYNFSPKPGDSFSEAFNRQWIMESTEQSLRNVQLETLSLQMLHVWVD